MLSYKNWKQINENFNRSLGLSMPQSLGIMSQIHTEAEDKPEETNVHTDGEMVQPSTKKDEADGPKKSKKCKYCGKGMKKEEHEQEQEQEQEQEHEEEHEEEHDDEENDEEEHDDEEHDDEEHDDEEHDDEEHDEEEHDEEEHDEEEHEDIEESKSCDCEDKKNMKHMKHMKHMKCMKCMKSESTKHKKSDKKNKMKKMKYSKKMKYMKKDVTGDGKADFADVLASRMMASGMKKSEAIKKAEASHAKHKKNESTWMDGVFGHSPSKKFYDGIFENLELKKNDIDEMKDFLAKQHYGLAGLDEHEFDSDAETAIYWFAHDHGIIDLMQKISEKPIGTNSIEEETEMAKVFYKDLEKKYYHKASKLYPHYKG